MNPSSALRSSRSSALFFVVVIVVAALIVAAVGFGTDGATALQVGGAKLSRASFNDELRALAENDKLAKAAGAGTVSVAPGSVGSTGSSYLSTWWIREQLALRVLDDKGAKVTSADRSSARDSLTSTFGPAFGAFPESFRQGLTDRLAAVAAVERVAPNAYRQLLEREAADAGVTVDPVYGLYHPRQIEVGRFPTPATPSSRG